MLIAAPPRARRFNLFRPLGAIPSARNAGPAGTGGLARLRDKRAGDMPEGHRKLVDIAIALAMKPKLLLMDEPTSGVATADKFGVMEILVNALAKARVASVFVEHDMDMVQRYAGRVAVWSAGKIQKLGPPSEVLEDEEVIRTVIGA